MTGEAPKMERQPITFPKELNLLATAVISSGLKMRRKRLKTTICVHHVSSIVSSISSMVFFSEMALTN